ncbi:MAG: STM4015 family protein [Myxococcota bacterium]|nr:STM4015 family protein [Myxococcota bacterium]
MPFEERATEFMGREIVDFGADQGIGNPGAAQRIALDWEASEAGQQIGDLVDRFAADPAAREVEALVIGVWSFEYGSGSVTEDLVRRLVAASDRLPALRGLFLGDIPYEEQECSWIHQTDVTPLLTGFPNLAVFRSRGSEGLVLQPVRHGSLQELAFESGGLPGELVRNVHASNLPSLRRLELWIGEDAYGRSTGVEDLRNLLRGDRFPALEHLALCNSEIAGETLALLCEVGPPDSVKTLDLSKGTLADEEARPLFAHAERFGRLERLDLSENFLSPAMVAELSASGLPVVADDQREGDEDGAETYRYVVVGE